MTTLGGTSAPYGVTATTLTSLATSGTPANPAIASANPGQAITIKGSGLSLATDVVFQLADDNGTVYEYDQHPTAVAADGSSLTVLVPGNAITGAVSVVGDQNNSALLLQIVPTISSITMTGGNGYSGQFRMYGTGFVDGHDSVYTFGSYSVVDDSGSSQAIDVYSGGTTAYFGDLRTSQDIFGNITVTTAGGSSAPYHVDPTSLSSVAASGAPADPSKASANPGQVVTVNGSNLSNITQVFATYTDDNGNPTLAVLNFFYVDATGTRAEFTVPSYLNGAVAIHVLGSTFTQTLDVVPMVTGLSVNSNGYSYIYGSGFVEGASTYTYAGGSVTDTSTSSSPIDVSAPAPLPI